MSGLSLEELIADLTRIKQLHFHHPDFQEWHNSVKMLLRESFGDDSSILKDYESIAWRTSDRAEDADEQSEMFARSCASAEGLLKAVIRTKGQTLSVIHSEAGENKDRDFPVAESTTISSPTAFISYSWDDEHHKSWVREFAARLRGDGVDVTLDQWETAPGDQLPAFMEQAIRDNDYVLVICTPRYKVRSENREGGVGYEGDIMTAEVYTTGNRRKFIPVLRRGSWNEASASWLRGSYYVDLRGDPYPESGYNDLLTTIYRKRPVAPPLGPIPDSMQSSQSKRKIEVKTAAAYDEINIEGIIVDEVTEPRMDGTKGSALYRIPIQLSHRPSPDWAAIFEQEWKSPPRATTMHRPEIATVREDRIILDGTTIEELVNYHRDTLVLVVNRVNELVKAYEAKMYQKEEEKKRRSEEHRKKVEDESKRLKFD